MEQLKQFEKQKQNTIETLDRLGRILTTIQGIGMDVDVDLKKIDDAKASIKDNMLRIALLGAFSDGKTSVIAAWLGRIMEDMKIDMDESSDKLAVYIPEGLPEKCEIVDTPGLFGDKQKEVDNKQVMYEDITRQYISEAHIILYVVDATNPLKDSHSDIVKWVLRDLNKLDSTVFVINKMDEVTDLTDPELFDAQARIKTESLQQKLQRAASLNDEEIKRLRIVCMAANPNGRGLPFWFEKPDAYRERSRIEDLKSATREILDSNLRDSLVAKTGLDVVSDLVQQRLKSAAEYLDEMDMFIKHRKQESERTGSDIQKGKAEIRKLARELRHELENMEKQLMGQLRSLSQEEIRSFLEDEIGYSGNDAGYKLHAKIKDKVEEYYEHTAHINERLKQQFLRELDSSEGFLNSINSETLKVSGQLVGQVSKLGTETIKSAIFALRDVIKNIGITIKFKPWEATKLAGNISKAAGVVGAAITFAGDVHSMYKENEQEQELQNTKGEIAELITGSFKDIYDMLNDDDKIMEYFGGVIGKLEEEKKKLDKKITEFSEAREKVDQAQSELKQLASSLQAA